MTRRRSAEWTNRCATEVSRSSASMYADATQRNALPTRTVDSTHCRRSANSDRRYDPPTRRNTLPTQTVDSTHCRRRPSIRPADAMHCRHDPVPTRTVADAMWRTADEEVDQCRPVEVDPLKCRWSLTITAVSHYRWMIFSDTQLHPTAYWLVWNKQDFLRTDFINLSVNCLVHTYAASKPISFLLVVVSLLLIDTGPWTLLQPQQTVAQFNKFCRMSTRLTPKVCLQSFADSRRNSNRIFFSLHVVVLRNCSRNLRLSYFVSLIAVIM